MLFTGLFLALVFSENQPQNNLVLKASLGDENTWVFGVGTQCLQAVDGTLFILDPKEFHIKKLNKAWEPVAKFGRRGKGPGEFEEPKTMTFNAKGDLVVFDPTLKRMTVFNTTGKVLSTHRLDASSVAIYAPSVLDSGGVVFLSARADEGKPVYDVSLFDGDLNLTKTLDRVYSKSMDWSQSSNPSFWVDFLANEMEMAARGMPLVCSPDGQQIIVARTDTYRLTRYNAKGEKLGDIQREVRPIPFSEPLKMAMFEDVWARLTSDTFLANNMPESVYRRAAAKAEVPEVSTQLKAIFPFGQGFGVLVNYHRIKQTGIIDLYNLEGQYLHSLNYEGPAYYLWGNQKVLYAIGPNADDLIVLNKYQLE